MNILVIKNPRQKRAVEALLEGPICVKDIGPIIGALNPRQVIFELRQQGFDGVILTHKFAVIDQDGKLCRPGKYCIPTEARSIVEQVLREHVAQTHAGALKQRNVSIVPIVTEGDC